MAQVSGRQISGRQISRRQLFRGGAGLATVAAAGGGVAGLYSLGRALTSDRSGEVGELRVGYLPITDATPLLIADGDGIYAEHRLTVARPVLFRSWASLCEAFLTRQVDVVHLLMPLAIQLNAVVGANARIISWNHTGGGALTVSPGIRDLSELAGTQVAIPGWWSIHSILVQRLLRSRGLTPVVRHSASRSAGTVELIVMSPTDMILALANGSIAGFTVADPFNTAAVGRGLGTIPAFFNDLWPDHACCVTLAHQDLIDRDPSLVRSVTDVVVDAQLRSRADPAAAAATLSTGGGSGQPYLPQPPAAIEKALTEQTAGLPGRTPPRPRTGFQPWPFPSFSAELLRQMRGTVVDGDTRFLDDLSEDTIHARMVDDRFVRASIDAAGGPSVFGLPDSLTRTERIFV